MPNAVVTLTGGTTRRETTTDDQGRFRFEALNAGRYQLTVIAVGLRARQEVVLQDNAAVDVRLEALPSFTDAVVVTASRDGESLLSAPASLSVVDNRYIEASAADTIPGLLQGVPGLNVTQFGSRDINVNARGATGVLSNTMLVMLDGRPLNQSFYGAVFWDLITVSKDEVAQIEVVRTPASPLWGANALSGAINIRTKSPRELRGLRGYVGVGERGSRTGGVTWADGDDRLSYKLSGNYLEQDPWPRDNQLPDGSPMPPGATFENRGTQQPKFDGRVDWSGNGDGVWSLRGGFAGANGLIHSALGPGEFAAGSYAGYVEAVRQHSDYEAKVYWNRLEWPFRIVLFGLDEQASNDTYGVDFTRQFGIGERHRLTAGGATKVDRFDISVAPSDRQRVDGAAFIEDRVRLTEHVTAIMAGRLDKFDTTSAVVSPRLGIVVDPRPTQSVRFTYNRAYRAPTLLENFVDLSLPAVIPLTEPFVYTQRAVGSTALAMEAHNAFEIGYSGTVARQTTVFATVYTQTVGDKIWFLPVAFYGPGVPPPGWPGDPASVPVVPKEFTFVNAGSVRDRGLEVAARVDWLRGSLRVSYTFQDRPRLTNNATPFPLELNRPPTHQASVGVTYLPGRWTLSSEVRYSDRAFWADVLTPPFWGFTDSYVNVDAQSSYRLPARSWEIWASATNLLDRELKTHVYGDTIRRRIMAGLRWRLD